MADESDFKLQNSAKAIDWSIEAVRAGMLVNGGAVVALLAFLGGEKQPAGFNPSTIRESLGCFAWGTALAFAAALVGYLAQSAFAEAHGRLRLWLPSLLTIAGITLMILCFAFFLWGSISAAHALFPDQPIAKSAPNYSTSPR